MALTSGLLDQYWRRYNQRRALTGLPSSYQEMRGMLDPMLEGAYNKDLRESELRNQYNIQNRQLSLNEQQAQNADRAATVSGIGNMAQLGLEGYLGYKALTKAPSALGSAVPGALPSAVAGVGSGGLMSAAGGVGSGAGLASAAYPGLAGGTSSAAAVGGMSPVVAETAGAGLLGTAGAVAGPAGLAAAAGQFLGKPVSKLLGTHEKTTGDVMSIGGGAAVGFAVGGPVGGVIGAALGGLASLF